MNKPASECPNPETLGEFARGKTESTSELQRIQGHLAECVSCLRIVDQTRSDSKLPPSAGQTTSFGRADSSLVEEADHGTTDFSLAFSQVKQGESTDQTDVTIEDTGQKQLHDFSDDDFGEKYRIVKAIGAGGMGAVYLAEQLIPVHRKVAIKLIHNEIGSESNATRFEAERQSLALMDHPNIAKIFDGGETRSGQKFFVMEYVDGVSITNYCNSKRLSIQARLDLFVQVCNAIQHAHQKGIIHRDIKPSNVLVSQYDGMVQSKLIDFGIAKPDQPKFQQGHTAIGSLVGTPEYMSPEQADFESLDIDTRSDIYSLGVLLYKLLTDVTPVDKRGRPGISVSEVLKIVRDEDAERPSDKLRRSKHSNSVAFNRTLSLSILVETLRRDLDWIVLKSLEKNRDLRYQTASDFANDIKRYLAGEPVLAHPPSTRYRVKKFYQRYKAPLLAASVAFFVLVAGVFGTSIGLVEANRQKGLAIEAEQLATKRLKTALAERERADQKADIAATVRSFLEDGILGIPETTLKTDPAFRANPYLTIREVLLRADQEANMLKDQPFVESEIRHTIGISLRSVGEYEKSIANLERSYQLLIQQDADAVNVGATLHNLALSYDYHGQTKKALEVYQRAADALKVHFQPEHANRLRTESAIAASLSDIGDHAQAIEILDNAIACSTDAYGKSHRETNKLRASLAEVLRSNGEDKKAISILEEVQAYQVKELGAEHLSTLSTMNNLALAYQSMGRIQEAAELLSKIIPAEKKQLGNDHPQLLTSIHNLAGVLSEKGEYGESRELYEKTVEISTRKFGPNNLNTLRAQHALAEIYHTMGDDKRSLPLVKRVYKQFELQLGEDNPTTLNALHLLASIYRDQGNQQLSAEYFRKAIARKTKVIGEGHPHTLTSMSGYASLLRQQGKYEEAVDTLEKVRDFQVIRFGESHPDTLNVMSNLGGAYRENEQYDEAIELLEKTLELRTKVLGSDHPDLLPTLNNLGVAYGNVGRRAESLKIAEQAHRGMAKSLGADHPKTLNSLANAAVGYWSLGKLEKSVPMFEEIYRRQTKKLGEDNPATLLTAANLGVNYRDAGKVEEGIRMMKKAADAIESFPRLSWVNDQLYSTYIAASKSGDAESLSKQLLAAKAAQKDIDRRDLSDLLFEHGNDFLRLKNFARSEMLLAQCVTIRKELEPNKWYTFQAESIWGEALFRLENFEEAEPHLLSGYEGLVARKSQIRSKPKQTINRAVDRLVKLYQLKKDLKSVKTWESKRQ